MSVQFASHSMSGEELKLEDVSSMEGSSSREEIRKVEELPPHQNVPDDKGKQHEIPQEQVIVIPTADPEALQQVAGDQKIHEVAKRKPLTPQEVARLTITPVQDAKHRQARSNEKFGIGMTISLGGMTLGCGGFAILGLTTENWALVAGMLFAAMLLLICCTCFLYGVLRSKGIIPHTENNLR